MKKFKLIKILWIIPTLILILFIISPIINNISASSIAQTIWETPLPTQTERVEKISVAGKIVGNGNGMQFFGAILLKSECSLEELKYYYSTYSENEWSYVVEEQNQNQIETLEHSNISFETSFDDENYFIVYTWGNGISPFCELDIRGH